MITENRTNASTMTLTVIENNRYKYDLLVVSDSPDDIKRISSESISLFESVGFKLRKWAANRNYNTVLSEIPKCNLGSNIRDRDLDAQSMPDSKLRCLLWYVENDKL